MQELTWWQHGIVYDNLLTLVSSWHGVAAQAGV
jgi:hypothetical protein